jgi:hypothetical protein
MANPNPSPVFQNFEVGFLCTQKVSTLHTAPDCMEYLSDIFGNVRYLVIVLDDYTNDDKVLLCFQEHLSVVSVRPMTVPELRTELV